jgi:hypothetical protein
MGQKGGDGLGALGSAMNGEEVAKELDTAARLAIVQGRLEADGETNLNLVDTRYKKVRHEFWLDGRLRAA